MAETMQPQPCGHLLCQKDSYLRAFESRVLSVEPAQPAASAKSSKKKNKSAAPSLPTVRVVLDDTVFFPEGGGQHFDTGRMGPHRVVNVQNEQGCAVHYVEGPQQELDAIEVGSSVSCEVDWARRWGFMQQHSAQHLITAIAQEMFGAPTEAWGLATAGPSSLDLGISGLSDEQVAALEAAVNARIRFGGTVTPTWMDPQGEEFAKIRSRGVPEGITGEIRVLVMADIDSNTCCGTHVQELQHLQLVKLLRTERLKAGAQTRLWFAAGDRAIELLNTTVQREASLTGVLACRPDDFVERVGTLLDSQKKNAQALKRLTAEVVELASEKLAAAAGSSKVLLYHAGPLPDMDRVSSMAGILAERCPETTILFTAGEGSEAVFVLSGPVEVVNELGKPVAELLGGRGGGRNGKFQGKCTDLSPKAMAAAEELLQERAGCQ